MNGGHASSVHPALVLSGARVEKSGPQDLCSVWSTTSLIRMEHGTQPNPVGDAVRELITNSAPSVRQAAIQSGVPYTTLHRSLHDGEKFTVANLNAIARMAGKTPVIFFKDEEETA